MKNFYILAASLVSALTFAQNGVIAGKITDGDNKFSLPGATIKIEDSNRYTVSDQNGGYEFLSLPEGTYTVYVEYIGYVTAAQEVVVTSNTTTTANFQLFTGSAALPDDKSITVLTQQAVSAHYLVNNTGDNEIYQLVDENKRSYHAGVSSWRADKNLNDTSIGIEIVNAGYTADSIGKRVFVPFNDAQVKKVAALAKDIITRYQIPPTNVLAHSDIAPTRKQDPGPLFPWKKLYDEYQIGMWYDEATKQSYYDLATLDFATKYNEPSFIFNVQTQLQKFGYGIEPGGKWDEATKKTIEAFQYHFRPQNYDGIMDAETWAILQALIQKYPVK